MGRSSLLLATTAALTCALGLAHTALAVSTADMAVMVHERPPLYAVGIAVATLAWSAAIVLTGSSAIALAGGVVAGGAAANVVSLAFWPSLDGVPNPLRAGYVAFNAGDVAVAIGLVGVLAGTAAFAARNRERLREPVRLSRS